MKLPLFPKSLFLRVMASAAAGFILLAATPLCRAQAAAPGDTPAIPQDLPPGAQDVVKLTQAGLNEDVIIAQVRSGGHIYRLTADQIIELTNAGVSQNVIRTLIGGADGAAVEPASTATVSESPPVPAVSATPAIADGAAIQEPAAAAPTAAPATFDSFMDELSPYGMWVQSPDYGWIWVPSAATGDSAWQPYSDQGQWLYTDQGWYWNSFYPWGRIAFHYGRWARMAGYGWGWIPDYTWGPSWVCWRHDEAGGFCGWAPLPPGAVFVAGRGLFFHGRLAGDIDFGLRWDSFVFCGYGHLLDRDLRMNELSRERVARVYDHSVIRNNYEVVNGRVAVQSLGRDRMQALSHREIRPVSVGVIRAREDRGRALQPRTNVPGRRDAGPAERGGNRPENRAPETRTFNPRTPAAPGDHARAEEVGRGAQQRSPSGPGAAPVRDSGHSAPAREPAHAAPAAEKGSAPAPSRDGNSSDKRDGKMPDRMK